MYFEDECSKYSELQSIPSHFPKMVRGYIKDGRLQDTKKIYLNHVKIFKLLIGRLHDCEKYTKPFDKNDGTQLVWVKRCGLDEEVRLGISNHDYVEDKHFSNVDTYKI
jgi:hypothetical protein